MTEVLLFHHAHGRTEGFLAFAETLRTAGHVVHTPDLYEGRTFDDLDEGVEFARSTGFAEIIARGRAAADQLRDDLVYAGFSLGNLPAQGLTQTRPGAKAALLFHGGEATEEFGAPWPAGVPLQMHTMEHDPWVELDVCQALAAEVESAELYVYPGSGHLFADTGSPDYEPHSA